MVVDVWGMMPTDVTPFALLSRNLPSCLPRDKVQTLFANSPEHRHVKVMRAQVIL